MQRRDLLSRFSLGCLGCLTAAPSSASEAPALWLAGPYQGHENLSDYWVSEKYDGIRSYWNGQQLLSRSGKGSPHLLGLCEPGPQPRLKASYGQDSASLNKQPPSFNKNKRLTANGALCDSWCLT
jgi:hypothetical protein